MHLLNDLQEIELNIAKEVIKICEEHKITYYLAGGTFLGAIRHKGFIPWDDDIDLSMPRQDYERFLKIAGEILPVHMELVNYKTDINYHYYITRVKDLNTKVEEIRIGDNNKYTHAAIDVFPLDGAPNNVLLRKLYYLKIMYLRAMVSLCYRSSIDRNRKRSKKEKLLLFSLERLPIDKIYDPFKLKECIDKEMKKYKIENSNFIGCLMGAYRVNEMVPKEYYGKGATYNFEGEKWNGPNMYDAYLKQFYGDYMELPPENERKIHYRVPQD